MPDQPADQKTLRFVVAVIGAVIVLCGWGGILFWSGRL